MAQPPLLMSIPDLLGARAAIQYINHQPNLPGSTMPAQMPQMGHAAQMPSLPSIPQPQQAQQDPQSGFGGMGGGAGAMQGLMNATGFNPAYYANKALGFWGQSGVNAPTIAAPSFNLSSMLPNLNIFGG